MAGVLKIYAGVDCDDPDLIFNSLLFDDENEIPLLAAVSCFMRRSRNRINGFMEETVPSYSQSEFQSHFRMKRETFEIFCREVMQTGQIRVGNRSGRPSIPPQKQVLLFLWAMANKEPTRTIADRFDVTLSSVNRVIRRITQAVVDLRGQYITWPNGKCSKLYSTMTLTCC